MKNRTMENTSGNLKCAFTVTGNCEDCSLPVGEDCPCVNDDDDEDGPFPNQKFDQNVKF